MVFQRTTSFFMLFFLLVLLFQQSSAMDFEFRNYGVDTLFAGPWEKYNRAPYYRIIRPKRVYATEGKLVNPQGLVNGGNTTFTTGSLITYEFKENIAGRVFWTISDDSDIGKGFNLSFGQTESPNFIGRHCDATTDQIQWDDSLVVPLKKGQNAFDKIYVRGAFKYLTVYIEDNSGGNKTAPNVTLTDLWVQFSAIPAFENPQAYTGYFYSNDDLLNRIWYAGAYTLQLSTIDPKEGGSLLDFNKHVDHNNFPIGAWASNYTISNGTSVTTDGAKRDRMVYAGDMTMAVPGIAVSTYDLNSIKNALETLFDHQYSSWQLPYAGPPMGFNGEFSDTYHMHALLGVYIYVHYSGDVDWASSYWTKFVNALEYSLAKISKQTGLFWCSAPSDWLRPGLGGYNPEPNAILHEVIKRAIELAGILKDKKTPTSTLDRWTKTMNGIASGLDMLWDDTRGMYSDNNMDRQLIYPQDGNSWIILAEGLVNKTRAQRISENLKARWGKYGAPAVEMPNVISPFATGFEIQAHCKAGNHQYALDLMRNMWGYMLEGPGMTNSTFLEGYSVDGDIKYPAYWSSARNSHAHGWSSGPTYVLSTSILGIDLLEPLGKTWHIEPHFGDLTSAEGGYATKLGKFTVKWTKGGALYVVVPNQTSGTIVWNGEKKRVAQGGRYVWKTTVDGSSFSRQAEPEDDISEGGQRLQQPLLRDQD